MGHLLKGKDLRLASLDGQQPDKYFLVGAYANIEQPSVVEDLHLEFIQAGAEVITTNNFAATPWALQSFGRWPSVPTSSCKSRKASPSCRMPASSERQMAAILEPYVDLFLCETLASTAETMAAASAACRSGKPFWVSWTLEDSEHARLRSGESLQEAVKLVQSLPGLQAVLVNCCAPQAITAALPVLRAAAPDHVQVGASANGFKTSTTEWLGGGTTPGMVVPDGDYDKDDVITSQAYAAHAKQWQKLGATILGGCCAVGPAHIKHMTEVIK
ncbi:hypothetical protein WJX82_005442 [Trebouxia sp. C0006]